MAIGARLLLGIVLVWAPAGNASTDALGAAPAAGRLLVASPRLDGSWFERSVVLLLDYGEQGAVGLIVDRPSRLLLADLLPEIPELRTRKDPVFLGGPVDHSSLFMLLRSARPPPESRPVLADVHLSQSLVALRSLLGRDVAGSRFRAYAGCAGWAPGQLDAEISRGDWMIAPGSAEDVFSRNPLELWQRLVHEHGGVQVRAPEPNPEERQTVAAR